MVFFCCCRKKIAPKIWTLAFAKLNFLTFLESSMPGHLSLQKGSPICVSHPKILAKGREYPAKNINKVLHKLQYFINVCILKTFFAYHNKS